MTSIKLLQQLCPIPPPPAAPNATWPFVRERIPSLGKLSGTDGDSGKKVARSSGYACLGMGNNNLNHNQFTLSPIWQLSPVIRFLKNFPPYSQCCTPSSPITKNKREIPASYLKQPSKRGCLLLDIDTSIKAYHSQLTANVIEAEFSALQLQQQFLALHFIGYDGW